MVLDDDLSPTYDICQKTMDDVFFEVIIPTPMFCPINVSHHCPPPYPKLKSHVVGGSITLLIWAHTLSSQCQDPTQKRHGATCH